MAIRTDNPGFTHKGPGRVFTHGLPRPYPLSATWWIYVEDRQAAGYFTAFAYGPSTFGGVDYYTAAGVLGEWSCGAAGTDSTTGGQIAENRWWRQGFRCRRLADNSVQHEFFYDLPNTASRQNNVDGAFNYFQTVSSSHFLRWADVEWSPNETLIGRIGGIKIWNAYLPQHVLAAEAMSHQIVCPEWAPYLWAHIPLRHRDDLLDWSGKGRRFYYPASLPTTIADPPLVTLQRAENLGRLLAASQSETITGSASVTLAHATSGASGAVDNRASAAPQLADAAPAATGTVDNRASASPQLGSATAAGAGTVDNRASASPQLSGATAAAAGAVNNRATAAPQLASSTAAASGVVNNRSSAAVALSAATASAAGTVGNVINGTADITLAAAASSAAGIVDNRASAAPQLSGATSAATGVVDNRASATVQLAGATAAAAGDVGTNDIIGSAAPQLAAAAANGVAQIMVAGAAAVALAGAAASASGTAGDVFVPIGGSRGRIGAENVDAVAGRIGGASLRTAKRRIGSRQP